MQNPFKYGCVVSGDHFCLRPQFRTESLILHRTKKEHDENGDKWIGVGGGR